MQHVRGVNNGADVIISESLAEAAASLTRLPSSFTVASTYSQSVPGLLVQSGRSAPPSYNP